MFYTTKQWAAAKKLGTFMGFVGMTVYSFMSWLENPISWIVLGLNALGGIQAAVSCLVLWAVIDVVVSAVVNLVAWFKGDSMTVNGCAVA